MAQEKTVFAPVQMVNRGSWPPEPGGVSPAFREFSTGVLSGNRLYLAGESITLAGTPTSYTHLQIVDITSSNLITRGSWKGIGIGFLTGLAVSEKFACVATSQRLHVIDITDPANPEHRGVWPGLLENGVAVAAGGDYAYILRWEWPGGTRWIKPFLDVIDLRDPREPKLSATIGVASDDECCTSSGGLTELAITGNYVFAAAADAGLRIVDVSDPAQPKRVGRFLPPNSHARAVTVKESFAYVSAEDAWLVLDITDPVRPRLVREIPTNFLRYGGTALKMFRGDRIAYAARSITPSTTHTVWNGFDMTSSEPLPLGTESGLLYLDRVLGVLGSDVFVARDGRVTRLEAVVQPRLEMRQAEHKLQLSWSTEDTRWFLEERLSLQSEKQWQASPQKTEHVGNAFSVSLELLGPERFFRLRR